MIVKDESHVIEDTLKNLWSYLPFDTYVISDTGSSDNTKALIKAFFDEQGVEGEIFDDPWVDFGHNRTLAFRHAANKSDYVFVWDADDRIHGHFKLPATLDADHYHFTFQSGDTTYVRSQLFNNRKRWKYVGVLHEYPACEEVIQGPPVCVLGAYHFASNRTGARNKDPLKYVKDATILERAFHKAVEDKDPLQNRYAFYCAQSYRSASMPDKALAFYKQVLARKDAWAQEKYMACIEMFTLLDEQKTPQEGIAYLIESYAYDKTRVEGIYRLIQYYSIRGQPEVARAFYGLIQQWYETQYDPDTISTRLFAKKAEYDYYLPYYMIIVADRLQDRVLGARMMERIVQRGYVPHTWWSHNLIHNLQFFLDALPADSVPFCHSFAAYVDKLALEPKHHAIVERAIAKIRGVLGGDLKPTEEDLKPPTQPPQTSPRVLLTFTTCKRWDLFQQTVRSILRSWTDVSQVDAWFCVDDNSSEEDRTAMRTTFPWIEYYMKGPAERGHRESMNLIWNRLQETKPTFWIHMEDDWLFFKREAYVTRAMKALDTYRGRDVQQVVFNRNYGVVYTDIDRVGGKVLEPGLLLHEKREGLVGKNCGYWPHYSLQPSMSRVEAILSLGNYDSPNRFFERDYANKYFTRGYQTAFFDGMFSIHIGKQHWETEGKNAYALNDLAQFNAPLPEPEPEPEPEPTPNPDPALISYPLFTGTMADHLQQLNGLMNQMVPFALIRPSDGEYSVIKGKTLTNCDKWTFQAGGSLQTDLIKAVQTDTPGLYIGIPCNTCNKPWNCTQTIYDEYKALVKTQNITYANIFMNANWPAFVDMLKEDTRPLYVVTSGTTGTTELSIKGRHIIDPFLVNRWDQEGVKETAKILEFVRTKTNALICFSAGPLSKVWIPKCWALNPTNTYLDVGAALDPFTKGPEVKSRFYTDRAHPFAKEACVFREKRNLIYTCVFHNKKYVNMLRLFLFSIKRIMNLSGVDILILTDHSLEPAVQELSTLLNLPLKTHVLEGIQTASASSAAKLTIYDYPEIHNYERILYLDTDILIQHDISSLFTEPLEKDRLYAMEEGTIGEVYHGEWFFDFNTLSSKTAAFNAGAFLFINSPIIQRVFKETYSFLNNCILNNQRIPPCYEQPYMNYFFIRDGLHNTTFMKQYIELDSHYFPPLKPRAEMPMVHYITDEQNGGSDKYKRMSKDLTRIIFEQTPTEVTTNHIANRSYTWDAHTITFKEKGILTTPWCAGTYHWIDTNTLDASWSVYVHRLFFNEDATHFLSVRKGDCEMGKHEEYHVPRKPNLIYMSIFHNSDYVSCLKLLLESIQTYSTVDADILIMTSADIEPSIRSLGFPVKYMILDAQSTPHEAACMRLDIFNYEHIQSYEKVLYLDTDIVIQGDLQALFTTPLEDKLYALEEGTISENHHGCWFFDFSKINKYTPAMNSGVLLFRTTSTIRKLFTECADHIRECRIAKHKMPLAYEQPYINYHFINANCYNTTLMKQYVILMFGFVEPQTSIPICHFAGLMGHPDSKFDRMDTYVHKKYERGLVYMSVFYNKDYIRLLRLLLLSINYYSSIQNIDILILTSPDFEPLIQDLSKELNIPLLIKTFNFTTLFEAATARLSIFDYEHIHRYNKILYLDTDILIKKSLDPFFRIQLDDKLYALEQGNINQPNFGSQFFETSSSAPGFNSGTLLFRKSETIYRLFEQIKIHIDYHIKSGSPIPYAMDQPFINYNTIKQNLHETTTLTSHIALFEDSDTPEHMETAIICHFSYPIGNFNHKYARMKRYLNTLLHTPIRIENKNVLVGHKYSWGAGILFFLNNTDIQTTWGAGKYTLLDTNRVCVYWNNFYHVLQFDISGNYFGVRTRPDDFAICSGSLRKDTCSVHFDETTATPLCRIMGAHGSDKGSVNITTSWHNYTTLYYALLNKKRERIQRVFELGLGTTDAAIPNNMGPNGKPGASLRGWAEFFPHADIRGADIDQRILFEEDRIKTYYCNQLDPSVIRNMWQLEDLQEPFDLIVEDGLHTYEANVCFFENSIHMLKMGGLYIIEDIHERDIYKFNKKIEEWKLLYRDLNYELITIPSTTNPFHNTVLVVSKIKIFDDRASMVSELVPKGGIYAEIGIFQGTFTKYLHTSLQPSKFFLLDLFEGTGYSGNQDGNNLITCNLADTYSYFQDYAKGIVTPLKGDSSTSLATFEDNYFDMIYVDGDHSYEGCKKDLEVAYRKIKPGGYVMGHDYEMNMKKAKTEYFFGVRQAVNEFCQTYCQQICAKGMDGCVSFAIQINKA